MQDSKEQCSFIYLIESGYSMGWFYMKMSLFIRWLFIFALLKTMLLMHLLVFLMFDFWLYE